MRKALGWLFVVLGVIVALPGIAAAVVIGPDSTVKVADGPVPSDGPAITIAPQLLTVLGPTVHVRADGGTDESMPRLPIGAPPSESSGS
jgi:hypothetical protein